MLCIEFIYLLELGVESLLIPPIIMLCDRMYFLFVLIHRVKIDMVLAQTFLQAIGWSLYLLGRYKTRISIIIFNFKGNIGNGFKYSRHESTRTHVCDKS